MNPEQSQLDALVSMLRRENELLRDKVAALEKENDALVLAGSHWEESQARVEVLEKENKELKAYVSDGVSRVGKK